MIPNEPYSIRLFEDRSYNYPWCADFCENETWLLRTRAEQPWVALDRLIEKIVYCHSLGADPIRLQAIVNNMRYMTLAEVTSPASGSYPDSMSVHDDENDSGENGTNSDASVNGRFRLRCDKCAIATDKYANGDSTTIGDRPNRYGLIQKLCYLCGLEEALAKLKMEKTKGTIVNESSIPPGDFEAWLTPGDRMRGHAIGVELLGPLPELTPEQMETFSFEYRRSY